MAVSSPGELKTLQSSRARNKHSMMEMFTVMFFLFSRLYKKIERTDIKGMTAHNNIFGVW